MIAYEDFHTFIKTVVSNEMDQNQKDIFLLEEQEKGGNELIDAFFRSNEEQDLVKVIKSEGLDFGFAPEIVNAVTKSILDIGTLLLSCLTLYLSYKEKDKQKKIAGTEKNESLSIVEEKLMLALIKHKLAPTEAKRIASKYSKEIKKLFDKS